MRTILQRSAHALIIGVLAFSFIGGCRKNGTTDIEPLPGEFPQVYGMEIDEGDWTAPAVVSAEDAAIYRTIYFDFDKSNIKPEFHDTLEAIAADLDAHRRRYVRAVGHCDERGTNEYNFALGERRAESVKAYLATLGVDLDHVRTLSKGEEEPADDSGTPAAYAKNRRVEFFIVDK